MGMGIGLIVLRLAVGLTLAYHGAQKLFGWFGGPGLEKTGAGMEKLGFVPGRRRALAAGLVEAVGGLLLALGLATPAAATLVFSVMLVAGISAHIKNGFSVAKGGYEFTLVLGLAGLSVAFTGPGQLSLDALLGIARGGADWGLGALLIGAAGASSQLAMRRPPAETIEQTSARAK
jgi:putative oxidoreductase